MPFFEKTVLPSGLRVVSETIPHVRSASVGVWVGAGSCWEENDNLGISHLIEHLLFKGTTRRSARAIAQAIDGRGGSLNAFTSKEHTCYYARVLDDHCETAVDVLADMLQHSLLRDEDVAKEKGVIVEEIKMYEDVPDDLVHDLVAVAMWEEHPLGRPIVGTAQTVQAISRQQIGEYLCSHYTPDNMVVAAAGNVSHEAVVEAVSRHMLDLGGCRNGRAPASPLFPTRRKALIRHKDTEQVHMVLGFPGLPQDHDDIWALHLANTILGGGPSSRLFQEIREERGLAYSVYSFQSSYNNTGSFGVYAGVSSEAFAEVMDLVQTLLEHAAHTGFNTAEVEEAKDQVKGQIMLSLESTSGRMSRLGRGELAMGQVLSPDEVAARISAVSPEAVGAICRRLLSQPAVLAAVGPLPDVDLGVFGFPEVQEYA